ncbi:hypothetical protein IT418_03700 [bacterium]|nr:hypothetical protein [bacterium]
MSESQLYKTKENTVLVIGDHITIAQIEKSPDSSDILLHKLTGIMVFIDKKTLENIEEAMRDPKYDDGSWQFRVTKTAKGGRVSTRSSAGIDPYENLQISISQKVGGSITKTVLLGFGKTRFKNGECAIVLRAKSSKVAFGGAEHNEIAIFGPLTNTQAEANKRMRF